MTPAALGRRLRIAAWCVALVPCTMLAQRATIAGSVVAKGTNVTLGYSVVGVTPGGADRFTDSEGRFAFGDLRAGRVRILVKHIGYAPLDTSFSVAAGDSIALRLELALVS